MTKTIPVVQAGIVVDDQSSGPTIRVPSGRDTPAWFAWLETPTTTCFSYALFNRSRGYVDGFMTAPKGHPKERRQRGAAYWTVYHRQGQRLRKLYVGPAAALTQTRLEQIALLLHPRDGPPQNPHFLLTSHPSFPTILP